VHAGAGRRSGACTLFIPPAECKVVEGFVAVTGWCNAFDLAD
jgi:hypothetical protein